jgi:hypothetical protein
MEVSCVQFHSNPTKNVESKGVYAFAHEEIMSFTAPLFTNLCTVKRYHISIPVLDLSNVGREMWRLRVEINQLMPKSKE